MTASMLETRSKGMGGWPRKVYDRADIKFHDNSVMKLRVSFQRRSFYLLSFFFLRIVSSLDSVLLSLCFTDTSLGISFFAISATT